MTYVMSDIHGMYDKYKAMLEKISFSDKDVLYILGDVVDRGEKPVDVLLDMMSRPNIYPIMGNHDFFAKHMLKKLKVSSSNKIKIKPSDTELVYSIIEWIQDGGESTIKQFMELDSEKCHHVLDYMDEFSLAEVVDVGKRTFILVHAGLGNFKKGKKLCEYTVDELLLKRPNPDTKLFDDDNIYVVMGHTPTKNLTGKCEILIKNNNIFIDCGTCFNGGKLGCFCLETMEKYYI